MAICRLRDAAIAYYRDCAKAKRLQQQVDALTQEIADLQALIDGPMAYPSQGVTSYQPPSRSGVVTDPTSRAAAQHYNETREMREQRARLQSERVLIAGELRRLSVATAVFGVLLEVIAPEDRELIEARWGPRRRPGSTWETVATQLGLEVSSVTKRIMRIDNTLSALQEKG